MQLEQGADAHDRGDRRWLHRLLSLFNIAGRFFWASLSDYIGRKVTYYAFFVLGFMLYASAPYAAHPGAWRCSSHCSA